MLLLSNHSRDDRRLLYRGCWACWILIFVVLVFTSTFLVTPLQAQVGLEAFPKLDAKSDWPWWRGPSRDGLAVS